MAKVYQRTVNDPETNDVIVIDVDVAEVEETMALVYKRKIRPYLENIIKWRTDGKGISTICKILDVSPGLFFKYRKEYPEFRKAFEMGTDLLADSLETALFREAVGYDYYEETLSKAGDVVAVKKVARPSISASKFALTNIRPKNWKNKVDTVQTTKLSGANIEALEQLSVDDLKGLIELKKKEDIVVKEIE